MGRWGTKSLPKGRYGNVKKPVMDNIRFDSGREMERYADLKILQNFGKIRDLEVHKRFPIIIQCECGAPAKHLRIKSKRYHLTGRQVEYECDFYYYDIELGKWIIEDVKMQSGHRTEGYKMKRALMEMMGLTITEY